MSTHVIVQYAYSFCSKQFKNIQKTVYDTETEETSYIRERSESPFINSNTLTEEALSLTNGNIFHLFFLRAQRISRGHSERTHQDSAAHCISALPRLSLRKAARSWPRPGRSSSFSPSLRRRTWSSHSNDPTDSTAHWLKETCHHSQRRSTVLSASRIQKSEDHNCSVFINPTPRIKYTQIFDFPAKFRAL